MSLPLSLARAALLALLALGLAPAAAQDGPLDSLARQIGQRSQPVESADFVRDSRPAELGYVPVHSKRTEPPGKLLTPDALKAQERELDALRAAHDKAGERAPVKAAYKPLQAPRPPKKTETKPAEPQPVKLVIPTLR
jgi:hypothetical protein